MAARSVVPERLRAVRRQIRILQVVALVAVIAALLLLTS